MSIATTAQPTKLYQALLLALRDMGPIRKTATNPGFRSKYADLPSILDTIDEPLHAHGLLVVQRLTLDAGGPVLLTELIHAESGETLTSAVAVVSKDPTDPQKFGSALTYYRRYALLALLGLAPEDDDGNAASQPARTPAPSYAAPQPRTATEPPPQVQSSQPAPQRASRSDDDYLAIVNDDTRIPERRVQAAKLFVAQATDAAGVQERVLRLTSLPVEERDRIRDAALDYLRTKAATPASYAG